VSGWLLPRQQGLEQTGQDRAWTLEQRGMDRELYTAQLANQRAQAAAAGTGVDTLKANQGQALIDTQQSRWLQQIQPAAVVADATQRIIGSLATGNAIGAEAAVVGLAKILDPTSTVREGEVTTIKGGTGIGQQLMSAFNKAKGKGFDPQSAKDLQSVVDANAIPILKRAIEQRQQFSTSLDDVLGNDYPGVGRTVTGDGINWGWVNQFTGADPTENPPGTQILDYNEIKNQGR